MTAEARTSLKNFQTLRTFRKPLRIELYGGSN